MTSGSHAKPDLFKLLQQAAATAIAQEDVWAKHDIPSIPAERIIRHLYHPDTESWSTDETICKIQTHAFAHGAMRHCFRMKKLATPPKSASNHRFHSYGWSRASNYVAKAYMTPDHQVDCSQEAKAAVMNDVILQYEAQRWARKFNETHPPKSIVFIRAYAIEFPDRPGAPWFPVERFIAGKDSYGVGFVKHNTNSGFVDLDLHRTTPQVFSAFSFYASQGHRLVADIQGVGDLYTDPQVLSSDYRFGDGDLGPRGMALFFHTFRHCSYSDLLGIPAFPLSKNELRHQAKYHEDDLTLSDEESAAAEEDDIEGARNFNRLDQNRLRRKSVMNLPTDAFKPDGERATMRRSNLQNNNHQAIRNSIQLSKKAQAHPVLMRSKSDIDEVTYSLIRATTEAKFDHKSFHRKASGELRERKTEVHRNKDDQRSDVVAAPPMIPTDETKANLGKVHYQLACLHGLGRFPEMSEGEVDVPSIIFHLSHAASLRNVAACLALGRIRAGLDTTVSPDLRVAVPIDFDSARDFFQRAMESSYSAAKPKAAAGCLLLQILQEEENVTDVTLIGLLEETLSFMKKAEKEDVQLKEHSLRMSRGGGSHVGDRVEANYELEGSYYPGVVTFVEGDSITVQYDDDGSSETHTGGNVRPLIPMTATNDNGGPLTDEEALGGENDDEKCILEAYALKAHLAELKVVMGDVKVAAALFQEAADGAMNAGKMKTATEWSSKASELAN